ncbi:MAG: DNA ligase [Deltaproteobacteria bacterium]|nr:MAG: DNA ligase [Deltaproteobacteria bacterium]
MNMDLSAEQQQILERAGFVFAALTPGEFFSIASQELPATGLTDDRLVEFLTAANLLYRAGSPVISDRVYDSFFLGELKKREPGHPFLHSVEPESLVDTKTIPLPERMLSTDKAYDLDAIQRWGKRIEKAAGDCGLDFQWLLFRGTPKLDGFAAYDDGKKLYTRGDGRRGTDISRVFVRGLQVANAAPRGKGPGEIVVSKSYFAEHLSAFFENSRNFQASLIKEKELEEPAARALKLGKAVFYPFSELPFWQGTWRELTGDFDAVVDGLWRRVDYDIDGVVFEIVDPAIKKKMGATRHHHRWQIAYKKNTDTAEVRVLSVIAQTSRSGRVNPVLEVEPVKLSGALIRRVTAHHYALVKEKGIGAGSRIRISRSGEVIPKIEDVLTAVNPTLPSFCPSCHSSLVWEGEYLVCVNGIDCAAQKMNSLEHFFRLLGNVDGFGPSTIAKFYEGGIRSLVEIYAIEKEDAVALGFGPKQSENLVAQLRRSREEAIEDWRFLAAFGVHHLGMGNCEKLLGVYPLAQVFSLSREQFIEIDGFSEKIADTALPGLQNIEPVFKALLGLGFNLVATKRENEPAVVPTHPLSGKRVVFTGTMQHGSREEMTRQAKAYGMKVGSSITGRTDLLVCGEKVGGSKLAKAKKLQVEILSEKDYLNRIVQK